MKNLGKKMPKTPILTIEWSFKRSSNKMIIPISLSCSDFWPFPRPSIDVHTKSLEEYQAELLNVSKREFDHRSKLKCEILELESEIARLDSMDPPEFQAPDYLFGPTHNWNGRKVRVSTPKNTLLF